MDSQLIRLCEKKKVRATFLYGKARGKGWEGAAHNWRVTIKYQGRQLTTDFFGGKMVREPKPADLLSGLLLDAQAGTKTFEEFCKWAGCTLDSEKNRKIWELCVKLSPKVHRLLGDDFNEFARADH